MSLKTTIDTAAYIAVLNTIGEYCHAIDKQDEAALVALFDEKAKLSVPLLGNAGEFVGSEGVKAFVGVVKARSKPGAIHVESNVVIGTNGNWFTNVSYWHTLQNGAVVSYGTHEDLLKVSNGTAKFVSRKIVHLWTRSPPKSNAAAQSSNSGNAAAAGAAKAPKPAKQPTPAPVAAAGDAADAAEARKASAKPRRRRGGAGGGAAGGAEDRFDPAITIYVAGLPKGDANAPQTLQALFAAYGTVSRIVARTTFAYVEFADAAAADKALAAVAKQPLKVGDATLIVERKRVVPPAATTAAAATATAAPVAAEAK